MFKVSDIRKAIEGLPDDAPVVMHIGHAGEGADEVYVELMGFYPSNGRLAVTLHMQGEEEENEEASDEDDECQGCGSTFGPISLKSGLCLRCQEEDNHV